MKLSAKWLPKSKLPVLHNRLIQKPFLLLVLAFLAMPKAEARIDMVPAAAQGQVLEIAFYPDESLQAGQTDKATISFHGLTCPLFLNKDKDKNMFFQGLLAVPADLDPGSYKVQIGGEEKTLTVKDAFFPVQCICLPKTKDNFVMSPGEKDAIEGAKATISGQRLWQGKFCLPSMARQSAKFGLKRKVNGRLLKDYFHSGLDFAAAQGQPVMATASGKVILVGRGFKLHGNTVAIDHGQGVVSFYIHLQQIMVKEGEMVEAGNKIATVGQTGRANGPHLHFSIYVNKTASNPIQWFKTAF